ncbi:recombination protein NinB [Carnimonas bestiolae]|uniref:recombination protein NinB n=1 Tax=Carnimonas bestiolae TaxID=3402172 RepID=UPI003EDBD6A1
MSKGLSYLISDEQRAYGMFGNIEEMVIKGLRAGPVVLTLGRENRSLDQNAKLWPMLSDIARQVQWPINGRLDYLTREDWKDILTAGLDKHQRVAAGIDGGFVILGRRTSKMKKKQFSELIEFIYWFGSEKGVRWSERALQSYEQYREATL